MTHPLTQLARPVSQAAGRSTTPPKRFSRRPVPAGIWVLNLGESRPLFRVRSDLSAPRKFAKFAAHRALARAREAPGASKRSGQGSSDGTATRRPSGRSCAELLGIKRLHRRG